MLKAIELWDFESHEHSRIEGLSDGLNVVCGPSNAGKTSFVRALKLVAYNEFDPQSVRVGSKRCKVRVETDKGWVQVTRGKDDNLWEITPDGQNTMFRDKIGKNEPPQEAVEILGLGTVTLGDIPVPVNIMDQLESHFMLSGIGNKDATGSVRAQIIDEISGLSGIEGIIKEVSLDNRRAKREVKQSEQQMEELSGQLHDEGELNLEQSTLEQAEEHLVNHQDALEAIEHAKEMMERGFDLEVQVEAAQSSLAALPNNKLATVHIGKASDALDSLKDASRLEAQARTTKESISDLESKLKVIPDHAKANKHLAKAEETLDKALAASTILENARKAAAKAESAKNGLGSLPDAEKARACLDMAGDAIGNAGAASALLKRATGADALLKATEGQVERNRKELSEALAEQEKVLMSIKVCPLNPARPVSKDCLVGAISENGGGK